MRLENLPIKLLVLSDINPRTITEEEMDQLCKNLKEDSSFLLQRPVLVNLVDGVYHVYAGTQRVRAAQQLGWKEIHCSICEDIPEEIIKRRIVLDNRHNGDWDWDMLGNNWEVNDLLDVGFAIDELHLDDTPIEEVKGKKAKKKECPHCGQPL